MVKGNLFMGISQTAAILSDSLYASTIIALFLNTIMGASLFYFQPRIGYMDLYVSITKLHIYIPFPSRRPAARPTSFKFETHTGLITLGWALHNRSTQSDTRKNMVPRMHGY